jgi:hypothetical protein
MSHVAQAVKASLAAMHRTQMALRRVVRYRRDHTVLFCRLGIGITRTGLSFYNRLKSRKRTHNLVDGNAICVQVTDDQIEVIVLMSRLDAPVVADRVSDVVRSFQRWVSEEAMNCSLPLPHICKIPCIMPLSKVWLCAKP